MTFWRPIVLSGALLLSMSTAQAANSRVGNKEDLGVGIALGQPTGLTGKYWLSSTSALDATLGYHFNDNFDIHADYLLHTFSSFDVTDGRLPWYIGLGGRILAGDSTHFGMRLPLGVSYLRTSDPIELFAEVAPVVKLSDLGFDIDGLVGVRLYLNYLK